MRVASSPWFIGLFALILAPGCGSNPGNGYSLDVGSDDGGSSLLLGSGDAGTSGALDAHIEQNHITVSFVTLTCTGPCADVVAVPTGGHPPYTFRWDDGSTGAAREVCPASSTSYLVKVTDTGTSGELGHPAQAVQVPVAANVIACPDGGTGDGGPGACDSVSDVSPSGANPHGAWSYGWSASLGAAFTRHTQFLVSPTGYSGIDVWTSGTAGVQLNPAAYVNPAVTVLTLGTFTAQPGQFVLHPGPLGQYSIARWTAPRSGTYAVRSTFEGIDVGPTTTDVHVQHNGADVAAGFINVNGAGNTYPSNVSLSVVAGDTVDFAVGFGNNGFNNDSTALSATVCSASTPDGG
jgi:hypothetical protein